MKENEENSVDMDDYKREKRIQADNDLVIFSDRLTKLMTNNKVKKATFGNLAFELHESAFELPEVYEKELPPLSPEEQKMKDDELLYYSSK